MNISRAARTRLLAATAAPLLALGLVACGDSDDDNDADDVATSPAAAASSSAPAPSTDASASASTSAPASAPAPGGDVLLTAAAIGLAAVDGGTVFAVDLSDTGDWEVSVVTADGTEQDVRVSADGATVTSGPVEDTDDADDAARDQDARLRLLDASVDLEAAVAAAAGSGSGDLTGAELDEENGVAEWEVQYGEDTPDEVTVHVDANSGDVLRTERDD